jgi:hypothetical protein
MTWPRLLRLNLTLRDGQLLKCELDERLRRGREIMFAAQRHHLMRRKPRFCAALTIGIALAVVFAISPQGQFFDPGARLLKSRGA